jgi:hypothetical protein
MQTRSLGSVALKTWAVILLVSSVLSVATIISQLSASPRGTQRHLWVIGSVWNTGYVVLSVIVALLLLKYADRLSEKLYPPEEAALPVDVRQLEQAAFGTVGVYFIVTGIRAVAAAVFQLATRPALETETLGYLWRNQPQTIVDGAVQLVAGLVLLLGRRGFAVVFTSLRSYSRSNAEDDKPAA